MYLASAVVRMVIPEAYSLKDRRRVLQSLTATLGRASQVAAADLSADGILNLGILGLTALSNDYSHAVSLREAALAVLDRDGRFEITSITTEESRLMD